MKKIKRVGNNDFLATCAVVVLSFAAALGFAVYLRATLPPDDGSYMPGEQEITPEIELLQEYLRIETTAGREIDGARFLVEYLADHGVEAELIVSGEGRANVYARLEGRRDGEGLLLLHHIDVKPASEEGWTRPPFAGEVWLNRLYGRGVLDMKGVGVAEMLAFVKAARSDQPLERDLVFLAVADEEQGSRYGMQWLVEHRPDVLEGIQYALNEGGVTEMLRDRIRYYAVETGGKQIQHFTIRASERTVLDELRSRWSDMKIRPEAELVLEEVDEYFRRIAPHREHFGPKLEDISRTVAAGELRMLHSTYLSLLQNNIAVSKVREVDGLFEVTAVLWYLPKVDPEPLVARMREDVADVGATIRRNAVSSPGEVGISSVDNAFFEVLTTSVRGTFGEEVDVGPMIGSKGVTDCRFLRKEGIDCYGFWPFPVTVYDSRGIHGRDERLRLDWFIQGVQLVDRIVQDWVQ